MSSVLLTRDNLVHACSGSLASMIAMGLFFPLEKVRSLAQVNSSKSSLVVIRTLFLKKGISGFYSGARHTISVLGISNFIYFFVFSYLKILYQERRHKTYIPGSINLVLASIAGIVNVLITTPLWVVATRAAVSNKDEVEQSRKPRSLLAEVIRITRTEGVTALWSGTTTSLMLVSNPAIQFSAYERLKKLLLDNFDQGQQMTAFHHLYLGALSKMVATILTYPLQLSQTRLRSAKDKSTSTLKCLIGIYKESGIYGWFSGMDAKLFQTCLTAAFMFVFYEKFTLIFTSLLKPKIKQL